MGIYIFLFLAAPAVYGCCLFYIRLGRCLSRVLARWGRMWIRG
jgi:hypothetical protein